MLTESSLKPYLIRAFREWAMDNGFTPQVMIDARNDSVSVPSAYISDDRRIVLNIHDNAINDLDLSNSWIQFSTRFNGVVHQIHAPLDAILAIYTRENSEGMAFQRANKELSHTEDGATADEDAATPPKPQDRTKKGPPHLRIVR